VSNQGRDVEAEAVKFLKKRKYFEKKAESGSGLGSIFHKTSGRDAKAVEAVNFLRKHFEERSWKRKQTQKRLTLYGAGSRSKKYSAASKVSQLLNYEPGALSTELPFLIPNL